MLFNVEHRRSTRRSLATLARGKAAMLLVLAGLLGISAVEGKLTSADDGKFVNLSTRTLVEAGEEVMIGGFVIEGGSREVLIQAVGPELANRGISNALADPVLTVTKTTDPANPMELMVNDNWEDNQGQLISDLWGGSPPLTAGSLSAAAVLTLEAGKYTAKVEGKDGTVGVGLVEVYEMDSTMADDDGLFSVGPAGRFVNLSTRALVETGEEVMIGGFIIKEGYRQVLVQAKGPELVNDGISNALADPVLTVTNTTDPANPIELMVNDNWEDHQGQLVSDLWEGSPPLTAGSLSAAAFLILEPGNYSAKVEGKDGSAGVAIVEVYGIDSDSPGAASPDQVALTALYNATNGANWERFDNWATGAPLDQWYGVKVDENGRVIMLDLVSNQLSGPIPPELDRLSSLQNLNLTGNELSGTIPPELGQLSELELLQLTDNELSGPIPPELGQLSKLKGLWLGGNGLSGEIPPELGDLSSLETLDLGDNGLSGPIPPELGQLSKLASLSVHDNELSGAIPGELSNIPSLSSFRYVNTDLCVPENAMLRAWLGEIASHFGTNLDCAPDIAALTALYVATDGANWHHRDNWLTGEPLANWYGIRVNTEGRAVRVELANNNLTGTIPPQLGQLAHLETLLLEDNFELSGQIPAELGNLANLREFSLSGTLVVGAIPAELGNLSRLETLGLAGASLTGAIPAELGNLANLRILELAFNGLTGAIPPELGNLSNLKRLWLDRNQLTGSIPPELGNLSQLEALSIEANKFEGMSSGDGSTGDTNPTGDTGPPPSSTGLTGAIPPELGNLSMLEILRLSQNSLTGAIPPELGGLSNLKMLTLAKNGLAGAVPPELGQLSSLEELNLAHNTELSGVLPSSLTDLGALDAFVAGGTGLCAPSDDRFTDWVAGLTRRRIAICEAELTMAYLTQAVQSPMFPVPLVAGEAALLRVFMTAPDGADANIPPVRATFYLGGAEAHVADIPGQSTAIPSEIDESSLEKSANAEIPAEVVQPGLEMVIEIDPDSTLDPGLDIAKRIPEQGRTKVEVREMPPFELTMIPFLWSTNPDSSVLDIGGAEDDFFWPTRTLLPIGEFRLDKHEPVTTSINDSDGLLDQTRAIRVMEGGTGYYIGIMSGDTADGPTGVAVASLPLAFAVADPFIVAHELGHNMGLQHAPCGGVLGDTGYPYPDGSIGAFGYDFRDGGKLVPPSTPDLMSYCGPPWIGDYHFGNALAFRLLKEKEATAAFEMETRTILLWGGVDNAGAPFLEPAFVVEAPPFLPHSGGAYEITGLAQGGRELFSLSFDMPKMADGDGRPGFAFALPTQAEWAAALASITLKGPGGSATLDQNSNRPMTILRNPRTGQVRGILRGPPEAASPQDDYAAAVQTAPDLEELFSRGIPDAAAWFDHSR